MAGISPECGICNNIYDELDRKPRVLLCGHTYCQPCLQGIVSQGSPACPSCRKAIVSQVTKLPVNFMLIPPSSSGETVSKGVDSKELLCSSHQNELDFWCDQCKILLCKRCLVQAHADHELILAEDIYDNKVLTDLRSQIVANKLQTESSLKSLQQLESLTSYFPVWRKSLHERHLCLTDCSSVLENISSESSPEQKRNVLKVLQKRNELLNEGVADDVLKKACDCVLQFQASNFPADGYMPDGLQWHILSVGLAEKALRTLKETGHTTPKAIVRSSVVGPLPCLFELLQYLDVASASMELELMDTAGRKWPDKDKWFSLKGGGARSDDCNHTERLRAIAKTLVDFQTSASSGRGGRGSSQHKVVAVVCPVIETHDVCVVASGGIVRRDDGSWPLPLEVHVVGGGLFFTYNTSQLSWLRCLLPTLYASAQPDMGECRVYLRSWGWGHADGLFHLLAELGRKFSAQHRVYLHSRLNGYERHVRAAAEQHKIPYEFVNF